jgi:amino acid transporter
MPSGHPGALGLKLATVAVGVVAALYATGFLYDYLGYLSGRSAGLGDVVVVIAAVSVAFSGLSLAASLPDSVRARFRRPQRIQRKSQVYGFWTILAVGIGATLGSPLFILIPQNVVQYEFVSVGSLLLAAALSVLMAKVYANMYADSKRKGLNAVGGPSFTRIATGVRSVRYFVARLSMWVANTALAAYSKIVFVVFDFYFLPPILSGVGVNGVPSAAIVYGIEIGLIAWTVLEAVFERNLLRVTGMLQIVLTAALLIILVYHSFLLGSTGAWNLSGIFRFGFAGNWAVALVINTGYLYLLFFGFQEIQSLEEDALERSSVPILSWIKKGYRMDKAGYLGVAMVVTVVVAAAINIFYGLAVYAAHPSTAAVLQSEIPALYLAKTFLGTPQELLMGVAFMIATVTTFVPAFLAASRHLAALGEDGYMPRSLTRFSWIFTLVAIFLLAVGNQNFLVDITDFMVLVSLGIIVLSAIWLKPAGSGPTRKDVLPLLVGVSCFVAGGAVYLISASVVVFGSLAILFAYLAFDVIELGPLGVQIFLSVLDLASLLAIKLFPVGAISEGTFLSLLPLTASGDASLLSVLLIVAPVMLLLNVFVDAKLLRSPTGRARKGRTSRPLDATTSKTQ